jgi:hypothetical protein
MRNVFAQRVTRQGLTTLYSEEGEVGWLRTEMVVEFTLYGRIRAAWRMFTSGTFTFQFFWAEAGPDTALYLDDISFEIGGR